MLSNQPVAIKFVSPPLRLRILALTGHWALQEPRKSDAPQLRDEFRSYRTLNGTRTWIVHRIPYIRSIPIYCNLSLSSYIAGVPQVHHFGQEGLHNVLVIDLLGPNLEDLFDMCGRKFTIKTVCMAAKQMVSIFTGCESPHIQFGRLDVCPAF
jgi:casein kinase 1